GAQARLDRDELDRFLARSLDHRGARVAERIGAVEQPDPLALELGDPGVEVRDPEADVVLLLAERADQRLAALVGVPSQHHVAELDPGARVAEHAFAVERRPAPVVAARHLAIRLAERRRGKAGADRGVEVLLVPEQRAERVFLPHMDVVEALGRVVAGDLDQHFLRPLEIGEAAAALWLGAGGLGLGDLAAVEAERVADAGPGIAADKDRAARLAGVERQDVDLGAGDVVAERLAGVGDVPAEMPDRALRLGRRRSVDLVEQDQAIVGRGERLVAAPYGRGRARELARIEGDRRVGIDRVEVDVVEAGGREHGGPSLPGPRHDAAFSAGRPSPARVGPDDRAGRASCAAPGHRKPAPAPPAPAPRSCPLPCPRAGTWRRTATPPAPGSRYWLCQPLAPGPPRHT